MRLYTRTHLRILTHAHTQSAVSVVVRNVWGAAACAVWSLVRVLCGVSCACCVESNVRAVWSLMCVLCGVSCSCCVESRVRAVWIVVWNAVRGPCKVLFCVV